MNPRNVIDSVLQRGVRGTAAAGIRRVAKALEGSQSSSADALPSAWSDYLSWLSFAVPGMLDRGNVDALSFALQRLPSEGAILEIGSFCGLSTCVISHLRRRHAVNHRFFTCDRWAFEGQDLTAHLDDQQSITHGAYRTFVRDSFLRNAAMFCRDDIPHTIEADSDTFFAMWDRSEHGQDVFGRPVDLGGPLSFCYIDGNHTYDFAKRDFLNSDRFLVPGGYILFDDSGDGSGWEVCRVVEELLHAGAYELVSKNPNYLVRKRG